MHSCVSIILCIKGNLTNFGIGQLFHLFFREFLIKPVPDIICKSPALQAFMCFLRNTYQQNIYCRTEQSCCRAYGNIIFIQMVELIILRIKHLDFLAISFELILRKD